MTHETRSTGTLERIPAAEAREHVRNGALLICAYEDEQKCRQNWLEGAMTMNELKARLISLPKEHELIFYCA